METFDTYKVETGASSSIPMNHQEIDDFTKFIKRLKAVKSTVFTCAHQALSVDKVEVGVVAL